MHASRIRTFHRRRFLRLLAGSSLLVLSGPAGNVTRRASAGGITDVPHNRAITSPNEAINVFDFEAVAREKLPAAHFGYLATGVDDDATLRANREGFSKFQIRPRRLVDVATVDTTVELFGQTWRSPIALAPAGSQKAFHPDGEIAAARAAGARRQLQILSTGATSSVEAVQAAHGGPLWFQLYATGAWRITQALVKRAEAAGCPVLVLTVDLPVGRNTETERRFARADTRPCATCHPPGFAAFVRRKPMFDGLDLTGVGSLLAPGLTWEIIGRLKDTTRMKLVVKGIETREDALLCVRHGADGIIVSNHGGRAEESGRSTIECLSEVVDAVQGRIPVLVDSGFRRGTDVFKALAIGARAICIGRPYLWGLAAFGQSGVARVLEILDWELELIMRHAGVTSLAKLDRSFVWDTRRP